MDGGETSGDSGGVRLTVSQDAVQEFQINRSNYAADLGAATGASINIVTKSAIEVLARAITCAPYRHGNVDVSFLDVSDSYVILTLTICGFVRHDLNF